jgi:hypothetical protein
MNTLKQAYEKIDSCLAFIKNLERRTASHATYLFGRPLPNSIINLIFEFDHTKREALNRCLNQYSKGCYDARCPAHRYISRYRQQFYGMPVERFSDWVGVKQERMAEWVDKQYCDPGQFGRWNGEVFIDGPYMKSVYPNSDLPVSDDGKYGATRNSRRSDEYFRQHGEFKLSPGDDRWCYDTYMCTYYSDTRDWRIEERHWGGTGVHTIGRGTREKRIELGLPIYTDKPRYQISVCKPRRRSNLVSNIRKNIKKWEKKNPQLCNY